MIKTFLVLAFVVLLLNSAYLMSFADPTVFYMANLVMHLVLGLLLAIWFAAHFIRNRSNWPGLGTFAALLLFAGAISGIGLIYTGAIRQYRWLLHLHIATATLGSILLVIHLVARAKILPAVNKASKVIGFAMVVALVMPIGVYAYRYYNPPRNARIVNPPFPPYSMDEEGGGSNSPFFPSSGETTSGKTIPSTFFLTSESCKRCHPDIFNQWNSSAHHFSSFNNQWYRKSIEYMQSVVGTKPSKWCGGCHDHAVLFNGMMDTPIVQLINTKEAQAGLACTSCHAITHVKSSMGQGDFEIEYPALHDLAVSENKYLQKFHDFLVFTDPEPHKKVFMKPMIRNNTAEFCSSCHKVHLDVPVNSYRWFRGFNDYDNWQASGVSGQGARAFYYPPVPKKCADCHMPLVDSGDPAAIDGKVHSHRFPGANTALPFVNRDAEQLRVVTEFLQNNQVTLDIFAFSEARPAGTEGELRARPHSEGPELATTFAQGEESMDYGSAAAVIRPPVEVIAPINKAGAPVKRGETVRLDVVVRTRGVGHFFPGGTVDAFDVWLELQAVDNNGKIIYWSGMVEDNGKGPVEKGAHFYRALMLDERGNIINKRNAWASRSVAYVRLIPPGAADTAHFRIQIPEDCGDTIHVKAKLNYRKFMWWNTQWAFAGIRDPAHKDFAIDKGYDDGRWIFEGDTSTVSGEIKAIPDLPIIVMDQDEATLKVVNSDTAIDRKHHLDPADRERWNDYGIGLLLQGDLKGAEEAFIKVTKIDPKYADGWVNIARARIQEGNTNGAAEVLEKALELDPELAKTHFFYALTLKTRGKYDDALHHLRIAAQKYPRDRVVRNQLGRVLFLQRKFSDAISEFKKTLLIDPEDLQAHYNLMLSYQGLGDSENAKKSEKLYLRFKADEASQSITGPFRKLHPEDNNERQPIHEHTSAPLQENNAEKWQIYRSGS